MEHSVERIDTLSDQICGTLRIWKSCMLCESLRPLRSCVLQLEALIAGESSFDQKTAKKSASNSLEWPNAPHYAIASAIAQQSEGLPTAEKISLRRRQ